MPSPESFTLPEARAVLAELRPVLDEIVQLRADATETAFVLAGGSPPAQATGAAPGGRAELKAAEARLHELLAAVQGTGVQLKGVAPLLLDFPAVLAGDEVLLCWLEGDERLGWYHRVELGFAGRRPLP